MNAVYGSEKEPCAKRGSQGFSVTLSCLRVFEELGRTASLPDERGNGP